MEAGLRPGRQADLPGAARLARLAVEDLPGFGAVVSGPPVHGDAAAQSRLRPGDGGHGRTLIVPLAGGDIVNIEADRVVCAGAGGDGVLELRRAADCVVVLPGGHSDGLRAVPVGSREGQRRLVGAQVGVAAGLLGDTDDHVAGRRGDQSHGVVRRTALGHPERRGNDPDAKRENGGEVPCGGVRAFDAVVVVVRPILDGGAGNLHGVVGVVQQVAGAVDGDLVRVGAGSEAHMGVADGDGAVGGAVVGVLDDDVARSYLHVLAEGENQVRVHRDIGGVVGRGVAVACDGGRDGVHRNRELHRLVVGPRDAGVGPGGDSVRTREGGV